MEHRENKTKKSIRSFTQLNAWKEAHRLVLMVYRIVDSFPKKERYRLEDQIIRAAISISSNIAEGFTRRGKREKIQFYLISKASLTELQNQLLIARDVGYISSAEFDKIAEQTVTSQKLLSGLLRGVKNLRTQGS